jgi:hypothetical protein
VAESRLRTLELIVCEELELRYVRGEMDIPRQDAPCYLDTRVVRQGRTRRRIGTAYLRLLPDTKNHRPDWHALASQLAEFLDVAALSDAIATLFTAGPDNRWSMLAQHSVERSDVDYARQRLRLPELEDDEVEALASVLSTDTTFGVTTAAEHDLGSDGVATPASAPGEQVPSRAALDEPIAEDVVDPAPLFAPPPVDYTQVQLVDAHPGAVAASRAVSTRNTRFSGGTSSAPSIQTEQLKRDVGERGEEIVYQIERERLERLGLDPNLVDWVSRRDAYSPHDMTSVEDGQLIYIEVKATTGSDPSDPFQISRGELVSAAIHRDRFYIYRVTDAYSQAPTITRFADPFGLVMDNKGEILLAKATMALTNEPQDETGDEVEGGID